MKVFAFAAVLFWSAGLAGAQQVQLLEDQTSQDQKKAAQDTGDMPGIIVPSDDKAPAVAPAAAQEAAAPVAAPAAAKAVPKGKKKKIIRGGVQVSTATVKSVAAPAARPAAPAAPAKDAGIPVIPPSPAAAPAPAPQPAPVTVKAAAPARQGEDLPTLESISAAPPAQAAAPKPAAVPPPAVVKPSPVSAAKPAETPKPAAVTPAPKPVAAPAAKPAAVTAAPKPVAAPSAKPAEASGAGFAVGKTHTVSGGDTLWDLSGKYYKDPYKWGKIYNANLKTVSNPDRIYPKEELVIPDITEEVRPELKKAPEITGGDTVKEADLSASEVAQPAEEPAQAAPAAGAPAAHVRTAGQALKEELDSFETSDLSEEMPEHQKEWTSAVKIVPDNWREDGVVTARAKDNSGGEDESLSMGGDMIEVSISGAQVKAGDYLAVYLKGAIAHDKSGRALGRELQPVGMLEVVSVDGSSVKARVADATTPVIKGYVVKKK
jgi:hypothetical protein